MYGGNCSKCGTANSANFRSNPTNYHQPKSGSWARAFGRGIAGIFLFFFGLGMILTLYYSLTNLDKLYPQNMYYGMDPLFLILFIFVIPPIIFLSIGGTSIYYGIRIISKT